MRSQIFMYQNISYWNNIAFDSDVLRGVNERVVERINDPTGEEVIERKRNPELNWGLMLHGMLKSQDFGLRMIAIRFV